MGVSDSRRRWAPVFAGAAGLCAGAGTVALLAGCLVEGAAAQTLAPWLKDARARVAAERALAGLDVHLAALFAPPKAD